MAYTKLFSSIVTSTIWMESDKTRIVWITLLALADKNGEVQGSIPGLARLAGVSVEDCQAAIEKLLSPDKFSRTQVADGRRIEKIDGGWELINHAKYRALASKEDAIQGAAERKRRSRARLSQSVTVGHALSHGVTQNMDIADADADADADAEKVGGHDGEAAFPETVRKIKVPKMTDPEWIESLKADVTFSHVDIAFEHGKAARWCEQKRKPLTRLRFLNWIGRIEKPMSGSSDKSTKIFCK